VLELSLLSFCCIVKQRTVLCCKGRVSVNLGGTGTRDVMCEVDYGTF